jgi:hypothetical protein
MWFGATWLADGWRSDERMVSGVFGPESESPPFTSAHIAWR